VGKSRAKEYPSEVFVCVKERHKGVWASGQQPLGIVADQGNDARFALRDCVMGTERGGMTKQMTMMLNPMLILYRWDG
jgi:hypothetical protein